MNFDKFISSPENFISFSQSTLRIDTLLPQAAHVDAVALDAPVERGAAYAEAPRRLLHVPAAEG